LHKPDLSDEQNSGYRNDIVIVIEGKRYVVIRELWRNTPGSRIKSGMTKQVGVKCLQWFLWILDQVRADKKQNCNELNNRGHAVPHTFFGTLVVRKPSRMNNYFLCEEIIKAGRVISGQHFYLWKFRQRVLQYFRQLAQHVDAMIPLDVYKLPDYLQSRNQ